MKVHVSGVTGGMEYRFASCVLNTERQTFHRDGVAAHLEPQVFSLLVMLAEAQGLVVAKDDLIETVWRGLNVSDATIAARVSAARTATGDDGKAQAIIRTVPKRGFQMVAEVTREAAAQAPAASGREARPGVRFATSFDGEAIAHTCHGAGPPLMRAGHWLSHIELDWDCPVWHPLLDELSADYTLHRYDPRGTGLSTRNTSELTLDACMEDLRAVADASGLDRFPIFAASQAVPIAIRFAARHPERVSRMVLYGGYATGRAYRQQETGEMDEDTALSLIRAGWGQKDGPFLKAFTTLFIPDATPAQIESMVNTQANTISADGAAELRMAVDRFRVEDDLKQVRAPVLVLHARNDAIHPMSQGQYLAAHLPDARFVMLNSRNHAPLPQDPSWRVLVDAIKQFCA